ncbi:17789_t:CDS:1 [Gigaspora margarita]|uniref:17789_t:CDS:1 n=1 Tax=Gigaspora margarita TaxID=4874 RepID=A0ABN7URQ9_GIGMA|nr:17789_t:CDS:1 [Gigaspora margarita]
MKEEDWLKFGKHIDTELQRHKAKFESIQKEKQLDNLWLIWNTAVKTAANKFIPFTYTRQKKFYAHSFKATKMHKALILMNKLISKIRNLKPLATSASIILEVDEIRKQVIDLTEVEIERIETEDMQSKREETIKKLKEIKIIFWTACNIENNKKQNNRIKFYTVQRYNNMKENTTRMINSILNRRTDYINCDKICTLDNVIVEESKIKTATKQHFQNWTHKNPTKMEYWNE